MWGWVAALSAALFIAALVKSGAWSAMTDMAATYNDSYIDDDDEKEGKRQ
jgi:hypothetical protein